MKNDELIITSDGYFNNAHLGFSGLPQINEGSISTFLTVSEAAFEQFLERTNLTEASKKSIMTAMLETKTPFSEIPYAVRVNYLVNGDVTATINVDVSPTENSNVVGVQLFDTEKDRLKTAYDAAYSKDAPPLEYALFEASIGKEVPPLALEDCCVGCFIDADNEEMLIRLSPSFTDLEKMVQRTPLRKLSELAADYIDVYAYIKPDNTVRVEMQPVQCAYGKEYYIEDKAILPLTSDEQQRITDAVDIELAKNNILFRLFDKSTEELSNLLHAKINGEYKSFITNMQKETVAVAIESAYEIVWKDNINEYCSNETPDLTPQQYIALLSSENTLDDVYRRFLKNEYANSYDDIDIVLEDTADTILLSTEVTIKGVKCRPVDAWQECGTSYLIGQSMDNPSFYYACAMNESITREYEYDHKPSREDVVSSHTDKLTEEEHMNTPIILHDYQTAKSLGEYGVNNFRKSLTENKLCAEAIIAAKKENTTYGDMAGVCYFDSEKTVDDVLAQGYPVERLGYVIASQVVRNQNCLDNPRIIDGRFSSKVKEWAIKTILQHNNFPFKNFEGCDVTSAMHHTLVNSLAESFIDKQLELSKDDPSKQSHNKKKTNYVVKE